MGVSFIWDNGPNRTPVDLSSECDCPCHKGEAMHIVECSCYFGHPVKLRDADQEGGDDGPPPIDG